MNPQPKSNIVLLEGAAYTEFRKEIYEKHGPNCYDCDRWLPLYEKDVEGRNIFNVFTCAHVSHKKRRAIGGDVIENCRIKCYSCHILREHFGERG